MSLVNLCADNIGDLSSGLARGIIDREIGRAIADLDDRGEDRQARKVTIELTFKKGTQDVSVDVKCKSTLPAYQTDYTNANLRQREGAVALQFRNDNGDNVDQPTIKDHGA